MSLDQGAGPYNLMTHIPFLHLQCRKECDYEQVKGRVHLNGTYKLRGKMQEEVNRGMLRMPLMLGSQHRHPPRRQKVFILMSHSKCCYQRPNSRVISSDVTFSSEWLSVRQSHHKFVPLFDRQESAYSSDTFSSTKLNDLVVEKK